MNIYIPNISEKLLLTKDFTFQLYPEDWNTKFILQFYPDIIHVMNENKEWVWTRESWHTFLIKEKSEDKNLYSAKSLPITISKDSILVVKNISIKTSSSDHNSMSLELLENEFFLKGSFWIKLEDAKNIEFEPEIKIEKSKYDTLS